MITMPERKEEQKASPPPALLTADQVATRLSVSRSSVFGLVKRGELPGIYVGKLLRFIPADIDAFINNQKTQGR